MRALPKTLAVGFVLLALCDWSTVAVGADPPNVQLAESKQPRLAIVTGENASKPIQESARELATYLGKMSDAAFQVETGDGSGGLVVGRVEDFEALPFEVQFEAGPFHREAYVIRSHKAGLYLLGASDLAVSHAVWDLLHRLGYRQFFPGETWEVIPSPGDLSIAIDVRESPDFYSRRIWYNWGLWGYNNEPYKKWCQRNRCVQGFKLNSGHAYGAILAANKAEFAKHPEYYAEVDGKRRTTGGDIKFCIANPGLRRLVLEHAIRAVRKQPTLDSISMDPSDGGNWCTCAECKELGSVSDRALMLANDVAKAINELELGEKYVGMYAYNQHSPPPTIAADKHVIISATTAFLRGGYTFDQIVEGWQARGATMGVYDYLSVVAWDWNLPRGAKGSRLAGLQHSILKFHRQGTRFYDAESGDCWGPCGLGYYLTSRMLWDVDQAKQTDEIVEDFLTRAFGSAEEPMREFYRLINQDRSRRPPSDLLGRMYRALDEARQATDDPLVLARINDLLLYTRYAEIYYDHAAGKASKENVARFAYRIRKTMMVHSYGLWARLVGQKAAHTKDHKLKSEEPFTPEELDKLLAAGIAKHVPVDPGFEGVTYSDKLVPAAARLKLADVPTGSFPAKPQDRQRYYTWLEKPGTLELKVRVQKVWANRMPQLRLFSPQAVDIKPVTVDESYQPDGQVNVLKLNTPYDGLHRVETIDGGDYTYLSWPQGVPITLESGIDTSGVKSHFRGSWTLYFYVPKGTKVVGGWASRIANWAPRVSGKLLDGSGNEQLDFAKQDEGWFKVPVPPGEDGKLWKFQRSQGQRLLMTVPPYLARNGQELLLPEEVVEADAR